MKWEILEYLVHVQSLDCNVIHVCIFVDFIIDISMIIFRARFD
jgi:hypothetical protein